MTKFLPVLIILGTAAVSLSAFAEPPLRFLFAKDTLALDEAAVKDVCYGGEGKNAYILVTLSDGALAKWRQLTKEYAGGYLTLFDGTKALFVAPLHEAMELGALTIAVFDSAAEARGVIKASFSIAEPKQCEDRR